MYAKVLSLLALVSIAHSHMHLHYPPCLGGDNNPNTKTVDPYLNYPYGCCGREAPGPCKGHLDMLDTDEGKPVVTWSPGQKVNFTLSGEQIKSDTENPVGGTHYGGSCQVGFSTDKGKTFKVATTWQGDCPLRNGDIDPSTQSFDFTVPADLPAGERVLFAWSWVNREKEFNMNCASVTISGSNGDSPQEPEQPSTTAAPEQPTSTEPSESTPRSTSPSYAQPSGSSQYTLEGCTCECPSQTWSEGCKCYNCQSPATKRHLVERKALQVHKRHLQNAEKLKFPVRRGEVVAFNSRPNMLLDIDFTGAECQSKGDPVELKFPNPGPDVIEGDGEYQLEEPSCS